MEAGAGRHQRAEGGQRPRLKILVQLFPQQSLPFVFGIYRNPPPDHWALVSGLPTYVAQNGLVSDTTLKGEGVESGGRVEGFQIKRVEKMMGSVDL